MRVFEAAVEAVRTGRRAALATLIGREGSTPRSAGARMLVYEDGSIVGTIGGGQLEHQVIRCAVDALEKGRPVRFEKNLVRDLGMCCGGNVEVYIEPLPVAAPFTVFGAGHVAHALVPLLQMLDFRVTVVDERDEWNTEARFPDCERVSTDPLRYAEGLPGGRDAHFLVVTHDHKLDQDLVERLLPLTSRWLGLIGSRTKAKKFQLRYRAAGMDEALFAKLRSPAGLDLGSETPVEIAVSIAAELVQLRHATP